MSSRILAALAIGMVEQTLCATDTRQVDLQGVWKAERYFGPEVKGRMLIRRSNSGWVAEVSDYTVPVTLNGRKLSFAIPGDRGKFTGGFAESKQAIIGNWVQPPAVSAGVRYATPLILHAETDSLYSGSVAPLEDKLTMFISVKRNQSGLLSADIFNPELNLGRFNDIKSIVVHDNEIEFKELDTDGEMKTRLAGTYLPSRNAFSVFFPNIGATFDFTRVPDSASGFLPRPRTNTPYVYRQPESRADGWKVASLGDVGMSPAPIEALVRRIAANTMDSITVPYIHALLIARHGELVVEEYFHDFAAGMTHDTRSASKSVTSTLVGIAINDGDSVSLSMPVYSTMFAGQLPSDIDPRARRMELQHLLTMTSGLACYDGDPDSPGNEDVMQSQSDQPDWTQYTLSLPIVNEPGQHAAYCSGGMNLAAAVLSKATDTWLPQFFQTRFAEPLQIETYHMNLTPTGEGYGGGGLRIRARDFLKLGQVMLDGGVWNGHRILSADWVRKALTPQAEMWGEKYGLGWWLISYPYEDRQVRAFYAGGNGGQYIIGIPELDLVILFYGANYNQNVMHKTKREYVPDYILKATELGEE